MFKAYVILGLFLMVLCLAWWLRRRRAVLRRGIIFIIFDLTPNGGAVVADLIYQQIYTYGRHYGSASIAAALDWLYVEGYIRCEGACFSLTEHGRIIALELNGAPGLANFISAQYLRAPERRYDFGILSGGRVRVRAAGRGR